MKRNFCKILSLLCVCVLLLLNSACSRTYQRCYYHAFSTDGVYSAEDTVYRVNGKYYVQGRIVSMSNDKIKLKLIDHNLIEYDSSTIEITVDSKTVYRIQKSNGLEENISYKDLSFGDKINGVSRQGNVKNNTIYVQKILLRD